MVYNVAEMQRHIDNFGRKDLSISASVQVQSTDGLIQLGRTSD